MTISRQLASTVGPTHGGVEFLKGFFLRDREAHNVPDEKEPVWKDIHCLRGQQSKRHTRVEIKGNLGLRFLRLLQEPWRSNESESFL